MPALPRLAPDQPAVRRVTDGWSRPLDPSFADRVAAERLRDMLDGDPDALDAGPIVLRPAAERAADRAAAAAAAGARRRQDTLDELSAAAALLELLAAPDGALAPPAESQPGTLGDASAAPNLDTEGFPQRKRSPSSLDSLNNSRTATHGALALSLRRIPRTELPPGYHSTHDCCQNRTRGGPRSLVGYRPREQWDVAEGDDGSIEYSRTHAREAVAIEALCRSWRCGCCRFNLRRRNRKRAIKGALGAGRTWFITITLDRKHPLYQEFRQAELAGERAVVKPGRKKRGDRSGRELGESRITRKPRHLVRGKGAERRLIPIAPLLGSHAGRAVLEPGGRLLTGERAETLMSIRYASQSFNRLSTLLARHFGHRVAYYRALELHPGDGANAGIAHVHVLLRTGSLQEWFMRYSGPRSWRGMLRRAGFGEVTRVELVRDRKAASHYVTKMTAAYTSKDMAELPRWTRRGAWSRDWCEWEPPTQIAGFSWVLARMPIEAMTAGLQADGWQLLDPGAFRIRPAPS